MAWQFVNTGYQSGSENMRVDGELVQTLTTGGDECFVRVYGWSPWAVSLGWNQSLEAIELEKTARAGIDVVRRPTGGRAILHADELTYSVAMVADSKSVAGVYNEISRALVGGLRLLGVRAVLERSQPNFPGLYRSPSSVACFVSSARHEVKIDGKKIVGSAQRRYAREDGREAVLQHGSILLSREHRRLGEFLRLSDQQKRTVKEELEARTTDLSTVSTRGRYIFTRFP
ncbi:MAG: lipoate--protein ligase family protein [Ignavibacteriales bacterium]|nr:lipoate--protein ligase family protein [Ignavibacteriales bacterium]